MGALRHRLLLLVCLFALTAPLFAQSWRIADFQDVISVSADGSTLVKERINLVFIGQWHGIHRIIPIEYPGPRDATSEVNGADVAFETKNPLPMRGGMTIDLFLPKGIVKEPGALARVFWF